MCDFVYKTKYLYQIYLIVCPFLYISTQIFVSYSVTARHIYHPFTTVFSYFVSSFFIRCHGRMAERSKALV